MINELLIKYENEFSEQVLVFGSRKRAQKLMYFVMLISISILIASYWLLSMDIVIWSLIIMLLSTIPTLLTIRYRNKVVKRKFGDNNQNTVSQESFKLLKKYLKDEKLLPLVGELISETNRQAEKEKYPFYIFKVTNAALLIPIWTSVVNRFIETTIPLSELMFLYLVFLLFMAISIGITIVFINSVHDDFNSRYAKLNKIGNILNEIRLESLKSRI